MYKKDNFFITTPIYYVNDKPHIGHLYTTIIADTFARFYRLYKKGEVLFTTGVDEHGKKVSLAAEKAALTPQQYTNNLAEKYIEVNKEFNISNNRFIRTSNDQHKSGVQYIWNQLQTKGYIYQSEYQGYYSIKEECFIPENDLVKKEHGVYSKDGEKLDYISENSYFFKLSAFQKPLLEFYKNNPNFVLPNFRYNELIKFVEGGLNDISISRLNLEWGIKVPKDESYSIYVWIDALSNYITTLQYGNENNEMEDYWPCNIHVLGKDIIKFHGVYWCAILMALDIKLPQHLLVHGWWTNEGQKISKSIGNVIDPMQLKDEFDPDIIRYFLMTEINLGNDGNYSKANLIHKVNNDLTNEYGNLIQRTLALINKNYSGSVEINVNETSEDIVNVLIEELSKIPSKSGVDECELNVLHQVKTLKQDSINYISQCNLNGYIENLMKLVKLTNKYIDISAPWNLIKNNKHTEAKHVLAIIVNVLHQVSILMQPVIPNKAARALELLNICKLEGCNFNSVGRFTKLVNVKAQEILFQRIENK